MPRARISLALIVLELACPINRSSQSRKKWLRRTTRWFSRGKIRLKPPRDAKVFFNEVKEKQVPVPLETSDENDMEIDVYDLNQSTLGSYDFFSQESYEICKGMLASSPTATPAALEVAVSSTADKYRLIPRYR